MRKRLEQVIRTANETVPYYNNLFAHNGIDVYSGDVFEVLSKIPVTDKETIKKYGWPNFINNNYLDENHELIKSREIHVTQTSGTTGEPMHILWNNNEYYMSTKEHWKLRYKIAGIKATDRCCSVSHDMRTNNPYILTPYNFKVRMGRITYRIAVDYLLRWQRYDPVWLYMPASILSYFVNVARAENVDIKGKIRYVEFAEEPVVECYRKNVEEYFGMKCYDMYGCQETNGIAMQCEHGKYHIMDGNVFAEVYNNGSFSQYGTGKICLTGLYNTAMPFIRYKLNDTVTISKSQCKCGCSRPVITVNSNRFTMCTELYGTACSVLYPSEWFKTCGESPKVYYKYRLEPVGSRFSFVGEKSDVDECGVLLESTLKEFGISAPHIIFDSTEEMPESHKKGMLVFNNKMG